MKKRLKQDATLRRQVEAIARETTPLGENNAVLSPAELEKTVHDLRVHQIELEMQNAELRRIQLDLNTARIRYFDLYDLAPAGYLTVSAQGLILEANLAAATLLGVARETLINTPLSRFILKEDQDLYFLLYRQQNGATGTPKVCELRMVQPDGSVVWMHLATTVLHQANNITEYRVVMSDITERKGAEEALQLSEQRRSLLAQQVADAALKAQDEHLAAIYQSLDSIGLIVSELDEDDVRMKIFSDGAEKLFGYRRDEAIGRSMALICPPESGKSVPERLKKLSEGTAIHAFAMPLVRKSGQGFPAIVSVHPFDYQEGRFRKVVGVFRDISELMWAQDQLQGMNDILELKVEQRTGELQESQKQHLHAEKLAAIGQLSASIAHEFNNPLQGIMSVLKGLQKRAILEEEDRELLAAAIDEGDRIKDLIRSLQDFNRPSSGRQSMMDVHQSIDSILLLHRSEFNKKGIVVVRNYAERLPRILAVPDQIKQVFLNLLINARDASPQHGGVITVSTWQADSKVAVAFKDTGVGIKPADMEHIFRPFYTTKPEVKGTGLGLSVSYGIVKNHQGEIRVDSQPGEGATFTVLLPIHGSDEVAAATD